MVGIKADGSTYYDSGSEVKVYTQNDDIFQKGCCNEDSNILNSTKVINKFTNEIERFNDYKNAEIHKDGSANMAKSFIFSILLIIISVIIITSK